MHRASYESSYLTLLTEEEILNPFMVLNDTFSSISSPTYLQDEVFEILMLVLRRNYWMIYESPLILYKKYKKIMRLFEAGSLINIIKPDLSQSEIFITPYNEIDVNKESKEMYKFIPDPLSNAYQTITRKYNSDSLYSLRSDLYDLLFQGLMPTCVKYQYEFEVYVLDAIENINDLISALYLIHHHEHKELFAKDMEKLIRERERFVDRDNLYDYDCDIYDLYHYSQKEDIIKAIDVSKHILNTSNFWKLHGNPANILYYYHDFVFILDSYWVHFQTILKSGMDIDTKWQYPKDKKSELNDRGYKWIKKPWKYLHNQFEKKSINEWRQNLELCLEDVLSNQRIGYEIQLEHNETLNFIKALLFLQELANYEPKI